MTKKIAFRDTKIPRGLQKEENLEKKTEKKVRSRRKTIRKWHSQIQTKKVSRRAQLSNTAKR